MASSTTASRLFRRQIAILLGLLALSFSAAARPCRTFFISSYSVSVSHTSSDATITTFTEIGSLILVHNNYDNPPFAADVIFDRTLSDHPLVEEESEAEIALRTSQIRAPFGFSSHDFSSFRDRTKDIMSVALSLLFGVGCGALMAVVQYLIWSLTCNRDDDVDDDEEIDNPKKMGYVKIPAVESVPEPAKEAV